MRQLQTDKQSVDLPWMVPDHALPFNMHRLDVLGYFLIAFYN
jgi:hypothetical protein